MPTDIRIISALMRPSTSCHRSSGGGAGRMEHAGAQIGHMDHNRGELQAFHELGGRFPAALDTKEMTPQVPFGMYFCARS